MVADSQLVLLIGHWSQDYLPAVMAVRGSQCTAASRI